MCVLLFVHTAMFRQVVFSAAFLLLAGGAWSALPGNLKACKSGSDDYSECLSAQIMNAIKLFKNGNKKMGVNPIDPFRFSKLSIHQGTGPVNIKLDLKDYDMAGVSNLQINSITNDWKTMVIKGQLDKVEGTGDYSIEGKVMVLPISGTGKCKISLTGVAITATLKFSEMEKDGKKYVKVDTFDVDISPTKTVFDFKNLFNGDKALGDNMNLFLNENHEEIVRELKPAVTRGLSAGFTQLSNQIFSKVEASEIKR